MNEESIVAKNSQLFPLCWQRWCWVCVDVLRLKPHATLLVHKALQSYDNINCVVRSSVMLVRKYVSRHETWNFIIWHRTSTFSLMLQSNLIVKLLSILILSFMLRSVCLLEKFDIIMLHIFFSKLAQDCRFILYFYAHSYAYSHLMSEEKKWNHCKL